MRGIFVALDIETTGLDPERDAIIELGAVKFRLDPTRPQEEWGTPLEHWSSLVNPGRPLPYYIQVLTGITPQELEGAPSLEVALPQLLRLLDDATLVGHNIPFDLGFLNRDLAHWGRGLYNRSLDTFQLASILVPHMPSYSLGTLARELGIEAPSHAHRALSDAQLTRELLVALCREAMSLDGQLLSLLVRLGQGSGWGLVAFFQEMERCQARRGFAGTLGAALAAGGREPLGLLLSRERLGPPLRPLQGERVPLDVEDLRVMFAPGGLVARGFPGYEYRPQQVQMMEAVVSAFNEGEHLLVEAATGTGKSLAYLLPAVLFAQANDCHVVISTNTINLQDQLYRKDLPDLERLLPLEFRYALLKGRQNYLCRRRFERLVRSGPSRPQELAALAKILVWLRGTRSGDRAELNLMGQEDVWRQVRCEAEDCLGERWAPQKALGLSGDPGCPFRAKDGCFFHRARERAERAHIILVNHALLLADMAAESRVIPEYKFLIIDEAHHLEEAATEQFGFATTREALAELLREVGERAEVLLRALGKPSSVQGLAQPLGRAEAKLAVFWGLVGGFLAEYATGNEAYDRKVRLTSALRVQPAWSEVEIAWEDLSLVLRDLERGLSELVELAQDSEEDLAAELAGQLARLRAIYQGLEEAIAQPLPEGIYWGALRQRDGQPSLHSAPLHVGALLEEGLFRQKQGIVLTSATLGDAEGFDYLRERLNLKEARELRVDSPFDYASSTLLYIPTDLPEPNEPYHQKAMEALVLELCQATQGRALVLFTSYSQLRATYQAVAQPLGEKGIVTLGQFSGASRSQLLENFRTTPRAVLLGTRSFWEGVDVVGEALSLLVIARLPFPVPDEPIFAARSETFEDPFNQYALPQAVLALRQGFGRLIRSRKDRGVVVIMDRRLLARAYGEAFLRALPRCTVIKGNGAELPAQAARWIDGQVNYQPGMGL